MRRLRPGAGRRARMSWRSRRRAWMSCPSWRRRRGARRNSTSGRTRRSTARSVRRACSHGMYHAGRRRRRGQRHRRHRMADRSRDLPRRRAHVPLRCAATRRGVQRLGHGIGRMHLRRWQRISVNVPFDEISRLHENPRRLMRAVGDGDTGGRKRGPAYVPASKAPFHPSRSPDCVRNPDPSERAVAIPSTIVEGRPAPAPLRLEAPPGIRVDPIASGDVRREVRANDPRVGAPDPSVPLDGKPFAIGRQSVVKHRDRGRGWLIHHRSGPNDDAT